MSAKLTEKQRVLLKLMDILLNLKNMICSLGTPLFSAFESVGQVATNGVWAEVFTESSAIMKDQHLDAGAAWKEAVEKYREHLPLSESDFMEINDFGELLGKSDRLSQETVIEMERERIAELERKARENADTKGKLYRNLGALTGAAMVILLI